MRRVSAGWRGALFCVAVLSCGVASGQSSVAIVATAGDAPPGALVTARFSGSNAIASASSVVVAVAFDAARLEVVSVAAADMVLNRGKTLDTFVQPGRVSVGIAGGTNTLTTGMLFEVIFMVATDATPGVDLALANDGSSAANADAFPLALAFTAPAWSVAPDAGHHDADSNRDWEITLSELLRLIQFFNSDRYRCSAGTEDGYASGVGDEACGPHDSDFMTVDFAIDISELLRGIQLFNAFPRAYRSDPDGEDGFAPGTF